VQSLVVLTEVEKDGDEVEGEVVREGNREGEVSDVVGDGEL
jgi:hypothetical protein